MSTDLFCEIIAGERSAHMVSSDDVALAFLDIRPVFKGHVLVVPRVHVETLTDLDDVGPFFERVKAVARAVEEGLEAGGTFVAMNNRISQSVPHLHVHVVPRHRKDGLRGFFWPRTTYESADEAASYAARIAKAL
ncbi:HIT family protein [Nonomuraea fastidiosa]|uniref:HIT family protein n=1 Tax=Nonomuraea TaxID=83681 RepID=UPI003243927B